MARKKGFKDQTADLRKKMNDLPRSGMTRKQLADFFDLSLNTVNQPNDYFTKLIESTKSKCIA